MLRFTICLTIGYLCAVAIASPVRRPSYNVASYPEAQIVAPVQTDDRSQAQAAALTDSARAGAAAGKLNNVNRYALDKWGYEIGKPLLVHNYGKLTPLIAAVKGERSFVAHIDPVFVKDSMGNIHFYSEAEAAAAAI